MRTSEGFRVCMFLLERVKKRLFSYEERTATRLATLLDPRFKKEGFQFAFNANKIRTSQVDAIISLRQYFEYKNMDIGSDSLQFWKVRIKSIILSF